MIETDTIAGSSLAHSAVGLLTDMICSGPAGFDFYIFLQAIFLYQMFEYAMSQGATADISRTDKHDAVTFHDGSIAFEGEVMNSRVVPMNAINTMKNMDNRFKLRPSWRPYFDSLM